MAKLHVLHLRGQQWIKEPVLMALEGLASMPKLLRQVTFLFSPKKETKKKNPCLKRPWKRVQPASLSSKGR
jgi:hypothetical protein